jgi:uncharacterized protein YqfA (UPF0365 family)
VVKRIARHFFSWVKSKISPKKIEKPKVSGITVKGLAPRPTVPVNSDVSRLLDVAQTSYNMAVGSSWVTVPAF